jgi:hypothetical protein
LGITVLSGRADMISGETTLVQISLPAGAHRSTLHVAVRWHGRSRDVTSAFAPRADGRVVGLVTGLQPGRSTLIATLSGGHRTRDDATARMALTDYPISGPIFSGPHKSPFVCETQQAGLGPALDDNCLAPTRVDYYYRSSSDNAFHPYDPSSPPSDVAMTTTQDGATVPYIVRVESGVINRSIYRIGVLYNPAGQPWLPWRPQPGWVGKVLYLFGGGGGAGYAQGTNEPTDVLDDFALSQGWMVAESTLNVGSVDVFGPLQAETLMMTKEHIIKTYGPIRHLMGFGGSAGGWAQQVIAEQYPGLLDGIVPEYGFPDLYALTFGDQVDCILLRSYFGSAPDLWPSTDARTAVDGRDYRMCQDVQWSHGEAQMNVTARCPSLLPASSFYDPVTNPDGLRCDYADAHVNLLGRRESDGFANRPYDNVGVQYGLGALRAGKITPEQFADLNAKIGGFDIDGNQVPQRSTADLEALQNSYRNDLVTSGVGLGRTPIIDISVGDSQGQDLTTFGHEAVFNQILRARLTAANGTAANQVIFTNANAAPDSDLDTGTDTDIGSTALRTMDQWLTNIESDHSRIDRAAKVIQDKPAGAVDRCWNHSNTPADPSFCATNAPVEGIPRLVAGDGPTLDTLKCRLEPLRRSDYPVSFTEAEWAQLERAFPTGVCDWSEPSVGADGPPRQWVSYLRGPRGSAIGPAPTVRP